MNQYKDTFKRYEKKYLLSDSKYKQLMMRFQDRLVIDNFGKTSICNIYFDTPEHLLIRNSIEKPVYKEKLRLRSYGTPKDGDMVYVELKKKYKGVVYKRRQKMELSAAEDYLYNFEKPDTDSQITREIDWFLNFYKDIIPSMYISYNRIAMYGEEDPSLRVTFDSNILYRQDNLWLSMGMSGSKLLAEGQRLMEIKIPGSMPVWMSSILSELEIYPVSFSKYGNAYQIAETIKNNMRKKGEIKYA